MRKGRIVAGRLLKLAVDRHVHDLKHAGRRGYWFSETHATVAIEFMESCCHHSKGKFAGKPLRLTAMQKFVVWCLFGWRRTSDGLRRFKKAYLDMARKWGKSTFAAAIALMLLTFDVPLEAGAEIYSVATVKSQARIVHNEGKRMVRKSPALKSRLQILSDSIDYEAQESFWRVISSDGSTTDGQNLHGAIIDELHAFRLHHRDLMEKLHTASGARDQPLIVIITTAGDDKSLLWMEEREYAVRAVESVLTGVVIDDTLFSCICCLDDGDDPFDEQNWIKANPHIGVSVSLQSCREQANEARHKPTALNKFLRYICNIQTASSERAIMPELWARGGGPLAAIDGRRGFGGWDLGRSNDWAAVATVFPRETDRAIAYDCRVQCWTCAESPLRLDLPPFNQFAEHGSLKICSGDAVDFSEVEEYIAEIGGRCEIASWAYDKTFSEQLAQRLLNSYGFTVFPFSQSSRFYNEPIRSMLRLLKDGLLLHGDDPCLGWQAGNLTIRRNAKDEWGPEKKGGEFKIDGMVALLMALSEALYHGGPQDSDAAVVLL